MIYPPNIRNYLCIKKLLIHLDKKLDIKKKKKTEKHIKKSNY
jgi:hypothetical protein